MGFFSFFQDIYAYYTGSNNNIDDGNVNLNTQPKYFNNDNNNRDNLNEIKDLNEIIEYFEEKRKEQKNIIHTEVNNSNETNSDLNKTNNKLETIPEEVSNQNSSFIDDLNETNSDLSKIYNYLLNQETGSDILNQSYNTDYKFNLENTINSDTLREHQKNLTKYNIVDEERKPQPVDDEDEFCIPNEANLNLDILNRRETEKSVF
ncbi:MAG: hypothetical protein RL208_729 [Pseudomonadota bacterium]|jgi:hypothetical protein